MSPRPPQRWIRRLAVAAGVSLVLSGLGVALPSTASSVAPRAVSVTPDAGLANDVVTVSWSGFRPTTALGLFSVVIVQCAGTPTSLADCFTDTPFPALAEGTIRQGRTGPDGSGSSQFEVRPAANLPRLGCSATQPCSLVVFENDGVPAPEGGLHPTSVVVPISFARSQADCPPVSNFDVRMDGSSSAAPLFYRWAAQLCTAAKPLVLDYTETSSVSGKDNFLERLVDLGVTSLAATPEEVAAHPERGDFVYAPVGLTAVVVATNMRNPLTEQQLDNVVVSPRLVARMVTDSGVASLLIDPELRQLNPGVVFPTTNTSPPLLRAERNAATRLVTTWMVTDPTARRFIAGNDPFGVAVNPAYRDYPYPRDLFENVAQSAQFLPRTGQRSVALRMFYGVPPAAEAPLNPAATGFFGIADLPTARRFGLAPAQLLDPTGVPVAATDETILAGLAAMRRGPEGVLTLDPEAVPVDGYPLVKVDYAMVPRSPGSPEKAAAIARVLRHAVGPGQADLPPGYVPLPDDLRRQTRQVANALVAPPPGDDDDPGDPPPVETPDPNPTPTTVPSGEPPPGDGNATDVGGGGGLTGVSDPFATGFTLQSGTGILGGDSFAGGSAPLVASGPLVQAAGLANADSGDGGASRSSGGGDSVPVTLAALPALPGSSGNMVLPLMMLAAGLGLAGWGAGEVRPLLARVRSTGRAIRSRIRGGNTGVAQ